MPEPSSPFMFGKEYAGVNLPINFKKCYQARFCMSHEGFGVQL